MLYVYVRISIVGTKIKRVKELLASTRDCAGSAKKLALLRIADIPTINTCPMFHPLKSLVLKAAIIGIALLSWFAGSIGLAQSSDVKEDFQSSSLNQPGKQYPQVNSQRCARFRIVAPQAQSVTVSLGGRGGH